MIQDTVEFKEIKFVYMKLQLLIFSIITFSLPSLAIAEAYSWTDGAGRTIYGTNPPKSAHNLKNLSTRGLSKYSSAKVIDRLGWRGSLSTQPRLTTKPILNTEVVDTEIGVIKEGDLPAIDNLPLEDLQDEKEQQQVTPAKITYDKLKVTLDEVNSKMVTRCKIEVTNSGGKTANDIAVAFEFRDGTLVPGVGPASLEPGKSAIYKIAPDLTPLKLNFELARKNPEKSVKVVLDMH